jgi:hypothetical protein
MSTKSMLLGEQEKLSMTTSWWAHLAWVLSAAVLGAAIPAVFAGFLRLPRALYLIPYIGLSGAFLFAYARWSRTCWIETVRQHWIWGLLLAIPVGFFAVRTVLWQPASPRPGGLALALNLLWPGAVYGMIDALFLSVFPVMATWRALRGLGWTEPWSGRIAAGALSLLASLIVIGMYHLGYPEFRGPQVLLIIAGVGVQSLACLLTGSPLPAVVGHVAMHLAAVLHGMESVAQLPPHY